jgi:predicted deacylase
MKSSHRKKKKIIVFETGEAHRIDEPGIQEGINGTLRVMKHLGMIDEEAPEPGKSETFHKSAWVRARFAGIFHPKLKLGDNVTVRQVLGTITDPFGNENFRIVSKHDGKIIGLNNNPIVHKGDAIFHIAKLF